MDTSCSLKKNIQDPSRSFLDDIVELEEEIISCRRKLHQIPELGLNLPKTFSFVKSKLKDYNISYEEGIGVNHSIIALIKGEKEGRTIAFRADMDGLKIKEETGLSFQSTNGCMHACGHDAHTAILLGVGKFINQNKHRLAGNIVLIFQPGEEDSTGARPIANSGIFEKYNIEEIFGLHLGGIAGGNNSGDLYLSPGPMMSCLDSFKMTIRGKAAHGAYPEKSVDPITIASYIITSLQEIISREIPAANPGVISIGKIQAGTSYNVIPDKVEIEGTARAVTEEQRRYIASRIGELAKAIGAGFRASVNYNYTFGAPPLVNNKLSTEKALAAGIRALGESRVRLMDKPVMGGEDFAEYLEKVPGSFMFFENMLEIEGRTYPHHNPKFALDESKFIDAAKVFVQLAFAD